jgi:hypothetical protein
MEINNLREPVEVVEVGSLPRATREMIRPDIDPDCDYEAEHDEWIAYQATPEDAGVDADYEAAWADWCNGCDGGCWQCGDC